MDDRLEREKIELTPEEGFNLVSIDYFSSDVQQLYLVEHFDMYQDALKSKKNKKNQNDYFILYKGPTGDYLSR